MPPPSCSLLYLHHLLHLLHILPPISTSLCPPSVLPPPSSASPILFCFLLYLYVLVPLFCIFSTSFSIFFYVLNFSLYLLYLCYFLLYLYLLIPPSMFPFTKLHPSFYTFSTSFVISFYIPPSFPVSTISSTHISPPPYLLLCFLYILLCFYLFIPFFCSFSSFCISPSLFLHPRFLLPPHTLPQTPHHPSLTRASFLSFFPFPITLFYPLKEEFFVSC